MIKKLVLYSMLLPLVLVPAWGRSARRRKQIKARSQELILRKDNRNRKATASLTPYQDFFKKKAEVKKNHYKYNPYEEIIAGGAAFLIGNVGFFSTDSKALGLAYSGVQTIGIVNIGSGIKHINTQSLESSFDEMLEREDSQQFADKEVLAKNMVRIFAERERANRLSRAYTSGLLSAQYLLNIGLGDVPNDIENIYLFLAGVNLIVVLHSTYFLGDYEEFWSKSSESFQNFSLVPGPDPAVRYALTWRF